MPTNVPETQTTEIVDTKTGEVKDLTLDQWTVMRQQADTMLKSGFLPTQVNTPEKVLAIALKGRELGIGMMEALGGINVIQGKTSVSPQLMLALARRTGQLEDMKMEISQVLATVTITRKGQSPYTTHFGVEEANAQQLMGKDNYKKQAGTMFGWRALAANLRITFPDAISGLYTNDELNDGEGTSKPTIYMPKALEKKSIETTEAKA